MRETTSSALTSVIDDVPLVALVVPDGVVPRSAAVTPIARIAVLRSSCSAAAPPRALPPRLVPPSP
eukprot:14534-Eustigmatos_ZCMA.PRE.1